MRNSLIRIYLFEHRAMRLTVRFSHAVVWSIVSTLRLGINPRGSIIMNSIDSLDDQSRTELEAAAFRTLVAHLQERTDVQNIDLMNLAGFCRNCLSKYYVAAALERDIEVPYEEARERVYGEPYNEWKQKHQAEATAEQKAAYKETHG